MSKTAPYCNLSVEDHAVFIIKGQVSTEKSEQQYSHTPHISLEVTHHTFQLQVLKPGFHSSVALSHAPANIIRTPGKNTTAKHTGNHQSWWRQKVLWVEMRPSLQIANQWL